MMAGNPGNWWSMRTHGHHQQLPPNFLSQIPPIFPLQYFHESSSPLPHNSYPPPGHGQDFLHSWGEPLIDQEDGFFLSDFQSRKLYPWDHHTYLITYGHDTAEADHAKVENSQGCNSYLSGEHEVAASEASAWPHILLPSSAKSLNFSNTSKGDQRSQHAEKSSEACNTTVIGGAVKKARVQTSSTPPLKVKKEKLGDRITALHQLVFPFGKTDTASVLSEAIGYIRFLQGQIEFLSSPYFGDASHETQNPEHMRHEAPKDLRSRGLCLVPMSCTQLVGSDHNVPNPWAAPSFNAGLRLN